MSKDDSPTPLLTPLVLAIDVGSTGTRAGLYNARAEAIDGARHKEPHAFTTHADGTCVIDADQIVHEIGLCMDAALASCSDAVAGVALDTFASSLVGVDASGQAVTPCFTYADSRCSPQVQHLRAMLNEDVTQQRTGTRLHTSYLPARFLWLQQTQADAFARVDRWLSLGEYAWLRLIGTTAAGMSTAAWTGMLNRHERDWDAEMCRLVGVDVEKLSPIATPAETLAPTTSVSKRWPQLAHARWFAPISDGFASSVGAGSVDSTRVVLAAATSGAMRVLVTGDLPVVPRGLWCNRLDDDRSLLGGALNDVGRAVTWMQQTLNLPDADALGAALAAEPSENLPVVLPFFTGERSTGWIGDARAVFNQVNAATTPTDLYRATLEGVAWSYRRVLTQLMEVTGRPTEILGTGRVSNDAPGLMQIVADACGVPVTPIVIKRSTLRGTALHAIEVLAPEAKPAPVKQGATLQPDPNRAAYYRRNAERHETLYAKLVARD